MADDGDDEGSFYHRSQSDTTQTSTTPFGDVIFTNGHEETVLKPGISDWLHNAPRLASPRHAQWIKLGSNLILSTLEVSLPSRPEIRDVLNDMELLLAEIDKEYLARYCLWTLHDTPRPSAMEQVRLDLIRQQDNLPQIRGEEYEFELGGILRPNDSAHRHTNEMPTTEGSDLLADATYQITLLLPVPAPSKIVAWAIFR